jgi:hypothetical protein
MRQSIAAPGEESPAAPDEAGLAAPGMGKVRLLWKYFERLFTGASLGKIFCCHEGSSTSGLYVPVI